MIYDIYPLNSYEGNGSTTTFDFDFYIENQSQLNVFYYNENGAKTQLTYNVDYSINEFKNPNGSYITYPISGSTHSILKSGERISLELTLPISQETEYNNSSLLNLEALEYSFDYLTRLIQILSKRLNSCIETNDYTASDITTLIQQVINCASSAEEAYENIQELGFEAATTTSKGVVQIGTGINVDSQGVISITEGGNKDLNNLTILGNARLQYAPFAINSGSINNGANNTLTYSAVNVNCAACTITTSDGKTLADSNSVSYDVSEESDGSYYIFKNYTNGSLELISNFTISATAPLTPSDGDYWLDTTIIPAKLKYYDTSDWTTNNNLVYIGECTVTSGAVTDVKNRELNSSGYMVTRNYGANFNTALPDLASGISKSTSGFTADKDGWVQAFWASSSNNYSCIQVNSTSVFDYKGSQSTGYLRNTIWFPLSKGDVVSIPTGSFETPYRITFYPLKGVK